MTYSDAHVIGHANADIEQFAVQTANVALATPDDVPELLAPQIALSFVGIGPTMPTRQKLYGTFLSVELAEQLANGILDSVREAREKQPASGLVISDEAGMRAVAAQADQAQALRDGPASR